MLSQYTRLFKAGFQGEKVTWKNNSCFQYPTNVLHIVLVFIANNGT